MDTTYDAILNCSPWQLCTFKSPLKSNINWYFTRKQIPEFDADSKRIHADDFIFVLKVHHEINKRRYRRKTNWPDRVRCVDVSSTGSEALLIVMVSRMKWRSHRFKVLIFHNLKVNTFETEGLSFRWWFSIRTEAIIVFENAKKRRKKTIEVRNPA